MTKTDIISDFLNHNGESGEMTAGEPLPTRAGFIALIGAPNAGKSTLLNRLVGAKISITCRKAQTTRFRIRGVTCENLSQLIFVDTPGVFRPKRRLDRSMVGAAWGGAREADHTVLLIDAAKGLKSDVRDILELLQKSERRVDIALNKVDLVRYKANILGLTEEIQSYGVADEFFYISAETGEGVPLMRERLAEKVPPSPWLYSPDEVTDAPMKLLASEITREKIMDLLHEELPYNMTVETEKLEKTKSGTKTPIKITQTVYVTREGHRKILLGKGGEKIKEIGYNARLEMADLLERPVHLFIFVKVRENWQEDPERYRSQGLDFEAEGLRP